MDAPGVGSYSTREHHPWGASCWVLVGWIDGERGGSPVPRWVLFL